MISRGQAQERNSAGQRIHTLFSVECHNYFDWQTVGLMHSYRKAQQPGPITRLLSCKEEEKRSYRGMHLAPTFEVPSISRHPKTGDWYHAINKLAGILHWLKHSEDSENVDWVVILEADMIIRGPIVPWELGAEKGKPVAAYHGYLVGCDNVLAKLHTKHPGFCDKVGGLLAMHIDDLRALAPLWLSKTEDVQEDRAHLSANHTGDIYGTSWISEMCGYSFGVSEVGLCHKINDSLMIYPGYIPQEGINPILLHYGQPFRVGKWSFSKLDHHEDNIVYNCGHLFPEPPYPREVKEMEADSNKRRALLLSIECINTLNEGLLLQHAAHGCPNPKWSKFLSFFRSKTFVEVTQPKLWTPGSRQIMEVNVQSEDDGDPAKSRPKIHTIFSTECSTYYDWQTVGLVHSFHLSGQPGNITRLLSCTEEDLKQYKGLDIAPTHYVPSMSRHPVTGDWYPAIHKPAGVAHWLDRAKIDADYIVILESDMIMRGSITPWEFNAAPGRPVATPYDYLIGCDNELAKIHTRNPNACNKVGGVIIMHISDLRKLALLWLHKTEELRADRAHWSKNITGDVYESGWISEMYGYCFGAAELSLRHVISNEILIYPGSDPVPGVKYRVFHYGLEFRVGEWSFDKARWRHVDLVNKCWAKFLDPPDPSTLHQSDEGALQRDLLSIECAKKLNEALHVHHERKKCPNLTSLSSPNPKIPVSSLLHSPNRETHDPHSLQPPNRETTSEITTSRKLGKFDEASRHYSKPENESQDLLLLSVTNQTFTSVRFWIIVLWAVAVFGFVALMSAMLSSRKGQKRRGRSFKTKRRTTYSAVLWASHSTMGDSACLMHGFSYASAIPNEDKQGNPMHALGESISFGRFTSESLSWEKWSSFSSHKRYVEEAERYAQPGSVAQKKAFFEAHYKRIAAQKAAAALVDQENAANNVETKVSGDHANDLQEQGDELKKRIGKEDLGLYAGNHGAIAESNEVETGKDVVNGVTEASGEILMRKNSSNEIHNFVNQEPASGSETSGGTPQMEKPLLKNSVQTDYNPSVTSKKRSALSSFKSSIHHKTSKVPFTPAKPITPHFKKEHNVTRKSNVDSMDKKKSSQKSLRTLINMVPAKEPDKVPIPSNERTESSGVPPVSSKTRKDCATPLKTPIGVAKYKVSKYIAATPRSEDRRNKASIDPSALGSKTSGPKWHILSAVCPKSLTACRNKLQSPTLSTPFSLRTEERAARRKQKLEEKFNDKEAPKVQLQTKLREKAGNEFRKLSQSFCFKARPLPDFYKEREIPKNQMKKSSVTQPESTRKTYSGKKLGNVSMPPPPPPPTFLTKKNGTSKNVSKKKIVTPADVLTSQPERINHENKSPNIQQ
ncbi:unnamed protein product [Fraxinus pennsylvanica]|uniref:TPX2 C-terminal domain-containing protein n=1 Tax=Fraxinus pennsylvanica TaxID=56036 RepID=A0AAD2DL15_9LAMI|nr:unnamed protein product [Fraxinus pennsylvanica]